MRGAIETAAIASAGALAVLSLNVMQQKKYL